MPSQRHIDVPNQIIRVSRADTYSEYSQYARSEEDYSYNESYHGLDHESHCGCYDCQNVDEDEEDSSYYSSHDSSRAGHSLPANVTPISPPSRVSRRSPTTPPHTLAPIPSPYSKTATTAMAAADPTTAGLKRTTTTCACGWQRGLPISWPWALSGCRWDDSDAGNVIFWVLDIDGLRVPGGGLGFGAVERGARGLEGMAWSKAVVEDKS